MEQKRLALTAEPWGFGPSSKMVAVARRLGASTECDFFGEGVALDFARLNADAFGEVSEFKVQGSDIRGLGRLLGDCDSVLSVMDPWTAIATAALSKSVYYVDSLSWFWRVGSPRETELLTRAEHVVTALRAGGRIDMAGDGLAWHEAVPIAYALSTAVFLQRPCPDWSKGWTNVTEVGAIVEAPDGPEEVAAPDKVLVSLGGSLSHVVDEESARCVWRLVAELIEGILDARTALICCHPFLHDDVSRSGWRAQALSKKEMLTRIQRADVLLATAGLTTILEAASLGTPVVLLPEQHGGHKANWDIFGGDETVYPHVFADIDHVGLLSPERAVSELRASYDALLTQPHTLHLMRERLRRVLKALSTEEQRRKSAARQRHACLRIVGSFDGSEEVASSILH